MGLPGVLIRSSEWHFMQVTVRGKLLVRNGRNRRRVVVEDQRLPSCVPASFAFTHP